VSVNESLLDRQLSHAVYTQRFSSGLSARALRMLTNTESDLIAQIESSLTKITARGYDISPATAKRLQRLLGSIAETRRIGFINFETLLKDELVELASYEVGFQSSLLTEVIPVAVALDAPSRALLRSVVEARPFRGRLLRQWAGDLKAADLKFIKQQINIGMVEGEPIRTIVARVRGRINQTNRQAEAIVRTAVNHVSNHSRDELGKANGDTIKAMQWLSTLDGRTTPICQSRDKNVYKVDEGPRPPAHIGCRSIMNFIVKSWRELGINLDEAPAGTRASMDGQVPADISYGEWLRKQNKGFVLDTLGQKKGRLFLDGGLDVDKFVDRRGGSLTLDQLRVREADTWKQVFGAAA